MSGYGVQRCQVCGQLFQWLRTKWGRRLPFDYEPVPITGEVAQTGWAAGHWVIQHRRQIALAPLSAYPAGPRSRFQAAVTIHGCEPFTAHIAEVFAYAGITEHPGGST